MNYAPVIVNVGYNLPVFTPVAKALCHSLKELGCYGHADSDRRIIFGAHSINPLEKSRPGDIIYNLEIIGSGSRLVTPEYIARLRNTEVWDYSRQNVDALADLGITAKHVPLGYSEAYLMDPPRWKVGRNQDIDVLFYGSMNERRQRVIDQLNDFGLKVVTLFGVFGEELHSFIRRAKIVLDVAYYENSPVNQVRLAPLQANGVFAISETPAADAPCIMTSVPYNNLAQAIIATHYIMDNERSERAAYIRDTYRRMRYDTVIERALE